MGQKLLRGYSPRSIKEFRDGAIEQVQLADFVKMSSEELLDNLNSPA